MLLEFHSDVNYPSEIMTAHYKSHSRDPQRQLLSLNKVEAAVNAEGSAILKTASALVRRRMPETIIVLDLLLYRWIILLHFFISSSDLVFSTSLIPARMTEGNICGSTGCLVASCRNVV